MTSPRHRVHFALRPSLSVLLALGAILTGGQQARAQAVLPPPPDGYAWESLGIFVFTANDEVALDLSTNTVANTSKVTPFNQSLSLTTFDASSAPANQHFAILSSSYEVNLRGSGSAVLVNLQPTAETYSGSLALNAWEISGDGASGPTTTVLTRDPGAALSVPGPGASLFSAAGTGSTNMFQNLRATGLAATNGGSLNFNLTGNFALDVNGSSSAMQVYGTANMFADASLQTVYERFVLVPEPSAALLQLVACLLFLLRRRRG